MDSPGGSSSKRRKLAAVGEPVPAPDTNRCMKADLPDGARKINCCPPKTDKPPIHFKFPSFPHKRVRPAAHLVDSAYIAKFNEALQKMKDLCGDDPRSFNQQAAVHCAYCVGSYHLWLLPDGVLQVHHSWLFFPFHRWYLYFLERILGSLIKDQNFAIPFWNWDSPDGMQMPPFYNDPNSPFYDYFRNENHKPPTLVDLDYNGKHPKTYNETDNLHVMYNQMVCATTPELFLGSAYGPDDNSNESAYRAGDRYKPKPGAGSLELVPHNTIHDWCGDPKQPNWEDMGHFYSAGYDPIFYGHHANVDRMWCVWNETLGRKNFTVEDWLNSSFEFFDENCDRVIVKVRDCLDTRKLGYEYQDVEIPWRYEKPTPPVRVADIGAVMAEAGVPSVDEVFPVKLDKTVKAKVSRPKQLRSKEEKEEEEEVLLIDGIEVEANVYVKFDVFINEEDEATSGPHKTEWAGSFVSLRPTQKMKTSLRLGISELLEDLGAEHHGNVLVTLVPKAGAGEVSIGGAVTIEYLPK